MSPPGGGIKCFELQETTTKKKQRDKTAWQSTRCFYPLSPKCSHERCFYKRQCVKLLGLLSLETKASLMWFKDSSDATPSAFLTRFQTPRGSCGDTRASHLYVCYYVSWMYCLEGHILFNIGITILLLGPVVPALLDSSYITIWQTAHRILLERAGKSCLAKPARLWAELSTKPGAV